MATHNLLLLPGDGIGPEVMAEVKKLIAWMNAPRHGHVRDRGGAGRRLRYDAHGVAVTDETMAKAKAADAVIFGSVGGPKWDKVPYDVRPEAGLLRLRKDLALYANLRPAVTYPALADASSLKRELVEGLDIMILRELTGGVYFGEPKTITDLGNGQKRAVDTQVYDTYEIERIARVAFELARKRRNKVTSMEKRNVMKTGVLWNEVVDGGASARVQGRQLEHLLADAGGMQLVRNPKQFDVIVTDNLFGDMLSDVAAMLTGSLGMLASASLGEVDPKTKKRKALYEPVHGSAPDIAGKGVANPIAMIASFAMALRYSFGMGKRGRPDRPGDRRGAGQGLAHRRHRVGGLHARRHARDGRCDHRRDGEARGVVCSRPFHVMPGLVPGIHVLFSIAASTTWMAGTSLGHDEQNCLEAGLSSVEIRVVLAGQEERIGDRPGRRDTMVRHRIRRWRVVEAIDQVGLVGDHIAGHHLGAAIEIGALLHQDLGAGAALLIAMHHIGRGRDIGRRGLHVLPLARRGIGGGKSADGNRGNNCYSHHAHGLPRFPTRTVISLQSGFARHHKKTPEWSSRPDT